MAATTPAISSAAPIVNDVVIEAASPLLAAAGACQAVAIATRTPRCVLDKDFMSMSAEYRCGDGGAASRVTFWRSGPSSANVAVLSLADVASRWGIGQAIPVNPGNANRHTVGFVQVGFSQYLVLYAVGDDLAVP